MDRIKQKLRLVDDASVNQAQITQEMLDSAGLQSKCVNLKRLSIIAHLLTALS